MALSASANLNDMDWEVWRICVDSSIRTIDISLDKTTFLRSMILDYFPSKNSAFSTNWHPLLALFSLSSLCSRIFCWQLLQSTYTLYIVCLEKFMHDTKLKADLIKFVNLNSTYLNFYYYFGGAESSWVELSTIS